MQNQSAQTPDTTNAGILESIGQALDSIHSANAAAALLASHLSPILPNGAPAAIHELLSAGNRHEDAGADESELAYLIRSLSRHADALANAITATSEGVRL